MKIGLCYDTKEDYGFQDCDYTFCNFATEESISYIKRLLEACGYNVVLIGNHNKLYKMLRNNEFDCDIVFTTAEGINSRNREAWIPTLLEINNIPFVGMDAYGLSLTLDKIQTKLLSDYLHVPTADFYELNSLNNLDANCNSIEFPLIIKPYREGDSMGVHLVSNTDELIEKATHLFKQYKQKLLCEEYLPQNELTVSVCEFSGKAQVAGMTETRGVDGSILPIFSSEYKLIYGSKKLLPQIPERLKQQLEQYSLRLFKYTECHDYCRFDFRLDKNGMPKLIEITPLAAIGEHTSFIEGIKLYGYQPQFILDSIIKNACKRYGLPPES